MLLAERAKTVFENQKKYTIEKVYDGAKISVIKILYKERIYKALFYDEYGRLSSQSLYNTDSGKEIKNITYKSDGKKISSVRIYNEESNKLEKVAFYKADGKSISSIVLYDKNGFESHCVMYCDDGEVIRFDL